MMQAGTPQPEPREPSAPGAPPEPSADEDKADVPWRILGVVLALALGFAAAVMIVVMVDIGGTPRCDDPEAIAREREETGELVVECFDGSQLQKAASLVLGWPAGVIAAIGALVALVFAASGRHGRPMIWLTGAAIVLGGLSILVGSV
jgi:hypothetical protein